MKKLLLVILYFVCGITIGLSLNAFAQEAIPDWIKGITSFWVSGNVADNDFEKGIQYLIEHKIINISEIQQNSQSTQRIPHWIKNLAGMWINGDASDEDFTKAMEYVVNIGIITVNAQSTQTIIQNQTNMHNQTISTPIPHVATKINQTYSDSTLKSTTAKELPMLMLTSNNDRVYMDYNFNIVVKIFNPESNPQKNFDQFTGGIADVNITLTFLDRNNKIIEKSLGKTDGKGFFQDKIKMPYTQSRQEQLQVMINATKNGYTTQQITLPLLLIHP